QALAGHALTSAAGRPSHARSSLPPREKLRAFGALRVLHPRSRATDRSGERLATPSVLLSPASTERAARQLTDMNMAISTKGPGKNPSGGVKGFTPRSAPRSELDGPSPSLQQDYLHVLSHDLQGSLQVIAGAAMLL